MNGDGIPDYILNFDEFTCDGNTTFCGTGGCRMEVFASVSDKIFAKVFDDMAINIDFKQLDAVPAMIVSVHHSECDASEANVCLKTYKWKDGNFALINMKEATVKQEIEAGSDQPMQKPSDPGPAPPRQALSPKEQEEANSNFGVFLAVYLSAKECADSGFAFNQEMVDKISPIVREKALNVPQELKDKAWQILQSHYESINVTEQDCSQAMQQSRYMLPADVFVSKDAPKNPF